MALTAAQKVSLQRITRESLDDVSDAADDLTAEQQTTIAADIVTWNLNENSMSVRLKGGSKGVDFNTQRLLADIFYRVRNMLGFDEIAYEIDLANTLELVEFETGANFG